MFTSLRDVFWWCLHKLPLHFLGYHILGVKRQGALGDVLLITPVIKELKKRYPNSKIWVETSCQEALLNNQDVSYIAFKDIDKKAHQIIDLNLAYENRPNLHLVDAYSQQALGCNLEDKRPFLYSCPKDLKSLKKVVKGLLDVDKDSYIVMHQAVSWENRTWPKSSWDLLVKDLVARGLKLVIVGRKKDFSYEGDPRVINCLSALTLAQIKELIKKSKLFIGPDSALLHIAMTTQAPIVALFTVTDPKLRVTRDENVISVTPTSSCKFCLHSTKSIVTKLDCRFGTNHCLQEITPERVVLAVKQSLGLTT
jgi:ADP-heptose:LPS heptosyltransferase